MKKFALTGPLALALLSSSIALSDDRGRAAPVPLSPKPGVYRSGAYIYTLTELPRAEGKPIRIGSLARENAPVAGGDYYRLELPIGSFIWFPPTDGEVEIGWTRIDPMIKQSRWSMAIIAEQKNSQGIWVTQPRDPIKEKPPAPKPITPTGRAQ